MASTLTTRLGTEPEEGIKAPVNSASLVDLTLSGQQTVNSVALIAGDRCLARAQTDPTENGIYDVAVGAWTRATDFNATDDVVNGVLVLDTGPTEGQLYRASFSGEYDPGVTPITFPVARLSASDTETFTNKTIVVASNTITTAPSGGLIAVELNAALAELEAGKPETYATLAAAKAGIDSVGSSVSIQGRTAAGGIGAAKYLVVAAGSFTPNEKGDHTRTSDGNILVLQIVSNIFIAEQYGVSASETAANNILSLIAALDAAKAKGGGEVILAEPGAYAANAVVTLDETYNGVTLEFGQGVIWDVAGVSGAFNIEGTITLRTTTDVDVAKGDVLIPVASTTGMVVGNRVWIHKTTPDGQCDTATILSIVAGVSITLEEPVRYSWTTADGISVSAADAAEDIIITGEGTVQNLTASNSDNLITFFNAWNCHIDIGHTGQRQGTSRCVLFGSGTGPRYASFCSAVGVTVDEASENGIENYLTTYGNSVSHCKVLRAGVFTADGHGISTRGSGHDISHNKVKKCSGDALSIGSCRDITGTGGSYSGATVAGKAGIALTTGNIERVVFTGTSFGGNQYGVRAFDGSPTGTEELSLVGCDLGGNILGPVNAVADMQLSLKGCVPTIETSQSLAISTSGATETTLVTHTIPKNSLGAFGSGFRIRASLFVTGATDLKTIRLKFGATTILTSLQQFDEPGSHTIECVIKNTNALNANKASFITFVSTVGVELHDRNGIAVDTAQDQDIVITGQAANAADSITLENFDVTPLGTAI